MDIVIRLLLTQTFVAILWPLIVIGETDVRIKRQNNDAVLNSIFNIPITVIKQTSAAAQLYSPGNSGTIDSLFKIPISTLQAVNTLVKETSNIRRSSEGQQNFRRLRREKRDLGEERTFHRGKKKKRKPHHHNKPVQSHNGFFGFLPLFDGHYGKPPPQHWNPGLTIPQIINIFQQDSQNHHGHKPQGTHSTGHHYQVWEEPNEDWPGNWFGLMPTTRIENKVAPNGRPSYRPYK